MAQAGQEQGHEPVLRDAVIEALAGAGENRRYIDGTFGRGGHSRELLGRLPPEARLLVMDRDPQAITAARALAAEDVRVSVAAGPFSGWPAAAREQGWEAIDGLLLDLGVSSPQLDDPARGFSFRRDGPLDMRMGETGPTAADWLATVEEAELARVLREFGEERFHRRIARAIVTARAQQPITRTGQLAALVAAAVPAREPGKDPATRTFQAIRIRLNDELGELDRALAPLPDWLAPHGRCAIISFHSLEDRRVKRFLRDHSRDDPASARLPVQPPPPPLRLLGKARRPDAAEQAANPRSRSAVLRLAERRSCAP